MNEKPHASLDPSPSRGVNAPFGAVAVRLGYATPEQVLRALEEQRARKTRGRRHLPLGTVMVKMGFLSAKQMRAVLASCEETKVPILDEAISIAFRIRSHFESPHRIVYFTGVFEGEGVSTLTHQVALALALAEKDGVLLVDANFRSPGVHRLISPNGQAEDPDPHTLPGLSDLLMGQAAPDEAVHPSALSSLSLLPVGNSAVDFQSLLLSDECPRLIGALRERFGMILIDSAPLLVYPDSALLASHADGAVIAVTAGERRRGDVLEVKAALESLNVPVIGTILCEHERR